MEVAAYVEFMLTIIALGLSVVVAALLCLALVEGTGWALARLQQDSPKGGQCENRTPDTDRPGDRGAVQSGPHLLSTYGPVAFQLAFGGEERDRTDVSELFCSCRGFSTHGRKETI